MIRIRESSQGKAEIKDGQLACPSCGATCGHLHAPKTAYRGRCADEDACHRLAFDYWCESCQCTSEVEIFGHKGAVFVEAFVVDEERQFRELEEPKP